MNRVKNHSISCHEKESTRGEEFKLLYNGNNTMTLAVLLGVLALSITADAGASMHNPFYCYATDPIRPMINMANAITSYAAIHRFNFTTFNPNMSTCTPSRFWYMGREAARLPLAASVQRMIEFAESSIQEVIVRNYEAGRTTLCRQDYENLRNFTLDSEFGDMLRIENAYTVTEAGTLAMQNIAKRFQQALPNILIEDFSPAHYHFRHTGTPRTNQSSHAFATGLFGESGAENVIYEPVPEIDWFLRPFDFCPAFREEVADSDRVRVAFRNGPEMLQAIQEVNNKLGLRGSDQFDFDRMWIMYNFCRFKAGLLFETSNSELGPLCEWCAPFSVAHHLIFEYYEDLGFFYLNGYGVRNQRLLENLSCGVMQDLLRHMQSDNDADTKARIFVAHLDEFMGLLVALGIFRDVWPLHQHNFAQQSARNWITSLILTFSTNLSVVRFDCDDGDHELVFLFNERPILVPGCNQHLCKLSVIVNRFQRFIDADCSTRFCSND